MRSDDSVLNEAEDTNKELDRKARDWLHFIMVVVEQCSMRSELGFCKAKSLFRLGKLRLALLNSTFEALDRIGYRSRDMVISGFRCGGKWGGLQMG